MPRIPDSLLQAIKRDVSCESALVARGHAVQRLGADQLIARCPFHDDRTPSLSITPSTNQWHCLGACQVGGDVIRLVERLDRVSFRHAVERLAEGLGGAEADSFFAAEAAERAAGAGAGAAKEKPSERARLPCPLDPAADGAALLEQVVSFYAQRLASPADNAGLAYLAKRGLGSSELRRRFSLGLADRSLGLRLPKKWQPEGAALRERLEALGVFRATSGHEHLAGSVVVPIHGADGAVCGLYGRKITPNLRTGTPLHLYLPGEHRGVWNYGPEMVNGDGAVILCEALFDAMSCWVAGLHHVTASYGVNGFTADHLAALRVLRAREIVIAYDADAAGDAAASTLADRLIGAGFTVLRASFPPGDDANAVLVRDGAEALRTIIRGAQWLGGAPRAPVPALPLAASTVAEAASASIPSPLAAPAVASSHAPAPAGAAHASTPALPAGVRLREQAGEITIEVGTRTYVVRGLFSNRQREALRINLRVSIATAQDATAGLRVFVDSFDLYQQRGRQQFAAAAAADLNADADLFRSDLGAVLLALECVLAEKSRVEQAAKETQDQRADSDGPGLTPAEHAAALAVAKQADLLEVIAADLGACGLIGEETNKRAAILGVVSRLLDTPLGLLVQSSSAAGKTTLMDAILRFLPPSAFKRTSALSARALFYLGKQDLRHRVLALAEQDGAGSASYPLKLLQSDGFLDLTTTQKDERSGKLEGVNVRVDGPIMLFSTTTAIELDPELVNRCLVLTVDESPEQTARIHAAQRAAVGVQAFAAQAQREALIRRQQALQRILQRIDVRIPESFDIRFHPGPSRLRRDFPKVLTLIRASALLHQYQRERGTAQRADGSTAEFLIATAQDVRIGLELGAALLGRSLDDLPPQTRNLWEAIRRWITEESQRTGKPVANLTFTRREAQAAIGWSAKQVRTHLERLAELEYVVQQGGGFGQVVRYRVVPGIDDDRPASPVAMPAETAAAATTPTTSDPSAASPTYDRQSAQVCPPFAHPRWANEMTDEPRDDATGPASLPSCPANARGGHQPTCIVLADPVVVVQGLEAADAVAAEATPAACGAA